MKILSENLALLFYLGLWKPSDWSRWSWKSILYTLYTILIILISIVFFTTELLDLILVTSSINEFTNNIFMLSAILAACLKISMVLRHRNVFNFILDNFKNYLLENGTPYREEIIIWTRYSRTIRFITMFYMSTTFFGVTMMTYATTSINIPRRELLYRAWVPYNYSRPSAYWISALGQLVTMYILAGVNVAFVLLFAGIMSSICAQISIYRLRFETAFSDVNKPGSGIKRKSTEEIISKFVEMNLSIRRLFDIVHKLFSWTIMFQYSVGSIIFCASAYNMSQMKVLSLDFLSCVLYVQNIMIELFIMCVACDEITLEFGKLHNIFYNSPWYFFDNYNKKSIALMINNSMNPIYFTCGYVVHLSIDSFTHVLKLSYSIYNVLQSTF
ncbi:odorant receptor 2a-like [Microplitis mediator]|uniref:odorant receptor 2a-like n=1 Tax=Microplitis mediator TaxID=375433 RepID=UPI0025570F07|nr:odorant receptor 2a-like [Microplitis mediator]